MTFIFFMPILGWILGRSVVAYVSVVDHWIAFGLLVFVGIRMIPCGIGAAEPKIRNDLSQGRSLMKHIDQIKVGSRENCK